MSDYAEAKRLTDLLALSHVPRWGIVEHSRPQSVAEHTFRTLVIAIEIAHRLELPFNKGAILAVLLHDVDESRTGDIPTPAKTNLGIRVDSYAACPWLRNQPEFGITVGEMNIFELADQIEALTFIARYGTGPHAIRTIKWMRDKVTNMISLFDREEVIEGVIEDILNEAGR